MFGNTKIKITESISLATAAMHALLFGTYEQWTATLLEVYNPRNDEEGSQVREYSEVERGHINELCSILVGMKILSIRTEDVFYDMEQKQRDKNARLIIFSLNLSHEHDNPTEVGIFVEKRNTLGSPFHGWQNWALRARKTIVHYNYSRDTIISVLGELLNNLLG